MSLLAYEIIADFVLNNPLVTCSSLVLTPYLWVAPTTYIATELDETFKIDIDTSNVNNLYAFEFKLGYNTTLLNVVQVAQGSFFSGPPRSLISKLEANETTGLVWVSMSLCSSETSRNGSGTLATVTFTVASAPTSPSRTWCTLDLRDSILYDSAMEQILHESIDSLYFWKTMLDDPSETGLMLDLTTQKDGAGPNATDGTFIPGEIVYLIGHLTYDDEPVQQKMVAFEVRDPSNEMVLPRVAITNESGYAVISLTIPAIPKSIGTWTAVAITSVVGKSAWDWISFVVQVPVGGYTSSIIEEHAITLQMDIRSVILTVAAFFLITITKKHKTIKTALKR